jgi:hypothetical protein
MVECNVAGIREGDFRILPAQHNDVMQYALYNIESMKICNLIHSSG